MGELTIWELIDCARVNLANYKKTMNPAFLIIIEHQLEIASKQAEEAEKKE